MEMHEESRMGKPLVTMAIRFTYRGIPYSVLTHAYRSEVESDVIASDQDLAEYLLSSPDRMNLESELCRIVEINLTGPHRAI